MEKTNQKSEQKQQQQSSQQLNLSLVEKARIIKQALMLKEVSQEFGRNLQLKNQLKKELEKYKSLGQLNSDLNRETFIQGTKIIEFYFKSGVYKFSDIVKDAHVSITEINEELLIALKASYAAYRENANQSIYEKMDPSTRDFTLESLQKPESEA